MTEFPPPLPIDDPVLIFGVAMLSFLAAPLVLERARLPGMVGIVLVGVALGPDGLGILELDETFDLLGTIGLVYLMFVAGLEIDMTQFLEHTDRSVVFGLASFLVPQVVGTVVGYYALGLSVAAAALFASIFASHTLLAYPVVSRLGITGQDSVTTTIGGTIITDTLALLVLAVVVAATVGDEGIGPAFWIQLGVGVGLFFAIVWLAVPRIGRWFFRNVAEESYYEFLFVMAVLFASAYLAELAGIEHIVGAFLAGLVLNRLIPESGPLMNRVEFVGNALFIPFFLLWVGMHVDLGAISDGPETLTVAGALIVMLVVTKYVAAWLTGAVYGYSIDETMTVFGLSVAQAAAALAIVLIGFEVGLFDEHVLNGVILMMLVASVLSPAIVDRYGRAVVRAERELAYDPGDAPRRVMVPFSKASHHAERLLDLALIVRSDEPSEPLYTLSIARPGPGADAEVAALETSLEETASYVAGADVPVESRTRIDRNVASGIVRAVRENRISTLVVGWDGAPSRRQRTFGRVIDRVLARTTQLVIVAHVRQPVNTTTEVIVVLPPGIVRNEGFGEVVHTIEHVADEVGAPIRVLAVSDEPDAYSSAFDQVEPDVPTTVERVGRWDQLYDHLEAAVDEDHLVVAVSARRGTVGWDGELETLPKSVATLAEGNFLVIYPESGERADDRQFLRYE